MPTYANDIQQVSSASMINAQNAVQSGLQQYTSTVSGGMQRLMSDLGRMMPSAPPTQAHPYLQVRHGMYGHEMSLGGDIKAMFGSGTPETTTMYEYQAMAREDFSKRVTNAAVFGGLNTVGAIGGWVAGGKIMGKIPTAFKAGKAIAAARGMGAIGAGLTGGLAATGVGLLGMAAFEVGSATVGKIIGDVKDRQDITNFLEASSFRYMQGQGKDIDSKTGSGFNRSARGRIASDMKKIDLADSRFNMTDLKGILEKGTELGMFEGTKDADDFADKFKGLTKNLKAVTRVLHQSLSEGMQTIKDLKQQGFRGPGGINQAVVQADVLGTASGQTAAEMLSIGRQGAEMVRGTGINMATGSSMMQQTYGMVKSAIGQGTLSSEMVAQAGGLGVLSQQVMGQSIGMLNSDFGRGMMLSMMKKGGGLDVSRMESLASGQTTISQALAHGSGNIGSSSDYIKAINSRGDTLRDVTKQYGDMGAVITSTGMELTMAKEVAASHGVSTREAFKFLATQRGETESSINARLSVFDNAEKYGEKQRAALKSTTKKMYQERLRNRTDISGRISDKVDELISPISEYVGKRVENIQGAVSDIYQDVSEGVTDYILGTKRTEAVDINNKDLHELIMSGELDKDIDPEEADLRKRIGKSVWTEAERKRFAKTDVKKVASLESELKKVEDTISKSGLAKKDPKTLTDKEQDLLGRQTELKADIASETKFQTLDEQYGDKFRTEDVANASGDLNALAKSVFTGKRDWNNLSRDERMYLEEKVKTIGGMTRVEEQISGKKASAGQRLQEVGISGMRASEADIKQREEEIGDIRGRFIDDITAGDDEMLGSGSGVTVYNRLKSVLKGAAGSDEGAENLDSFVTSTRRIQQLEEKQKEGTLTDDEQSELAGAKKTKGESEKALKGLDEGAMKHKDIIELEHKVLAKGGQGTILGEYAGAKSILDEKKGGRKGKALRKARADRLRTLKLKASGELDSSSDREDLDDMLGKIQSGKMLDDDELDDLAEIGKTSGVRGISSLARQGKTIARLEETSKGKGELEANLKDFLKNEGALAGLSEEQQTERVNKYLDGDSIKKDVLMQDIVLGEGKDAASAQQISGGSGSKESITAQVNATAALMEVQDRTATVLKQLERLSSQLLDKTKIK